MKNLFTLFVSLLLLAFFKPCAAQTWTQIGPQGANIVSVQSTPTALFAAGFTVSNVSGIWKSVNDGITWESLTDGFTNKKIRKLWTVQDSVLVSVAPRNIGGVAQIDGGVFLSTNQGQTWSVLLPNTGFNEPGAFLKKGTYLYFGSTSGIDISGDLGQTWTTSTGGQNYITRQVQCFESSGDTVFFGTRNGMFRSLNNCVTWTAISTGLPTTTNGKYITGLTKIGGVLYASTYQNGVYKSTNRGASWVAANNGLTDLFTNSIYYNGNTLFVGTRLAGLFKSSDGGNSWASATSGMTNQSVNCFYQLGITLYAGGQDGVFQSLDNADNWTEINNGINGHIIGTGRKTTNVMVYAGGYLFAATYTGRIYRSADNGTTWEAASGDIRLGQAVFFNALAGTGGIVLASGSDNKVYRTYDWGNTWTIIPFPEGGAPDKMWSVNNRIYGVLYELVYASDDDGNTWVQIPSPSPCTSITSKGNDVFISGGWDGSSQQNHQVYRSENGTSAFTYMGDVVPSGPSVGALHAMGNALFAAIYNTSTGVGEGVYKSLDNGVTWSFEGLLEGTRIGGFTTDGNFLFARNEFNIFVRNNLTQAWVKINSTLPIDNQGFYSTGMFAGQGKLYAGVSSRSLYTADLAQFTFTAPAMPGPINGSATPCIGSSITYSVPNVPFVTYTWQFPAGWTVTSGGTTNAVTVTVGSMMGIILVTPANIYGSGPGQFLVVTPNNNPPSQPSAISGSVNPVEGSSQAYSVVNESGVTYTWTYPSGWVQTGGGTTNSVTVTVGSGAGNITVTPSTPCGNGTSRSLMVTPVASSKTLTLNSILLEGLYDGSNRMREANGETGPQFGAGIADQITVELHNAANYGTIEHTFNNVQLDIYGSATITVPTGLTGDYYLTIKHRNSIATVSSSPVSFAGSTITYAFNAPAQAYGGNLLLMIDGTYVIYGGDVNQDGTVDSGDMTPLDNDATNFMVGYLATDVNGDGSVDSGDMTIVDNNATGFISAVTP